MSQAVAPHGPTSLQPSSSNILIASSDTLPGYRIVRTLGMARGNTVRARNFGVDFFAGLKNLVGGEVKNYTKLLSQSREQALDRMREEAQTLGGNAIVAVRITTSTVMAGAAEILAYGTVVVVEAERG